MKIRNTVPLKFKVPLFTIFDPFHTIDHGLWTIDPMKKHIPNIVTLMNMASGCAGIVLVLGGQPEYAAFMVFLGAAFDFADGFVARALNVPSELGKQLDSLSDLVTFGVLPSILLVQMLLLAANKEGIFHVFTPTLEDFEWYKTLPLFIVALGAGYRLGKFNIDTRQTTSFLGMPSPANGIFFASLYLGLYYHQFPEFAQGVLLNNITIYILAAVFTLLMISEIPMFAMKVKGIGWKGNEFRYILLIVAVVLIILFKFAGVALTIVAYVLLSIIENLVRKNEVHS